LLRAARGGSLAAPLVCVRSAPPPLLAAGPTSADITLSLECLRPWLETLPDPDPLRSDLEGADALALTLAPLLSAVAGNVTQLLAPAQGGGFTGDVASLLDAEPRLQQLRAQQAAFAAAAGPGTLNLTAASPAAMLAARDALAAAMSAPPWDEKLAAVNATANSMEAIKATVAAASADLAAALAAAAALLSGPAAALNATLAEQSAAYASARPCVLALRARVAHVSAAVFALPPSLAAPVELLNSTQHRLDEVLGLEADGGAAGNQTTSAALAAALAQADASLATAQGLAAQLAAADAQLSGNATLNIDTLVTLFRAYGTGMASSQGEDVRVAWGELWPGPSRCTG
jgi:hypothetical protein